MMKLFVSLVTVFVVAPASLQETAALRVQGRWVGQNGKPVDEQNGRNVLWGVQSFQPQVRQKLEPVVGGRGWFTRWGNPSRQSPRQAERLTQSTLVKNSGLNPVVDQEMTVVPETTSEQDRQADEQNALRNVSGQGRGRNYLK